jgi:hypothetical protein
MSNLEPGVQLSPDTIAAMERLSTSPSKPPMTEIEELRTRVEALEATQRPHQDKLDRLMALDADDGEPIVVPSPPACWWIGWPMPLALLMTKALRT